MAVVTVERPKQILHDSPEMTTFLGRHGIAIERWPIPSSLEKLRGQATLSDAEKGHVLQAFQPYIERERMQRGYIQSDMVVLNPSTPNLQQLLAKFDKTHYHDDEEIRFIVDGEGIFGFEAKGAAPFSVLLTAGDYLIVPAKIEHWFTLTDSRSIKAIRLFKDMSGWAPHYKNVIG